MCVLYWKIKKKVFDKKGREAQQYNKKICGPQFSIIALWIYPSFQAAHTKNYFYTRVNFFFVFPSAIFPFSLYLCIESILYFNSIVSECYERCTFEPKLYTMHNHPSLIHSFSLPSIYNFFLLLLLVLWFIREILFLSASTSFFLLPLLLLLFMYQTAFFDVTLIFPSSQYFFTHSEGCQWWMRKERAQRAISIHL